MLEKLDAIGHGALHLDEVGGPVAEREHEPEAEDNADDRQDRAVEPGKCLARPRVELLLGGRDDARIGGRRLREPVDQALPPADAVQTEECQRQE